MTGASVYQLYQMSDTAKNQLFLYQDMETILARGGTICSDRYELAYEGALRENMGATAAKQELESKPRGVFRHHSLSTSDVIVLRRPEETLCYFMDRMGLVQLFDFFSAPASASGTVLTPDTTGYAVLGKPGLWSVADTIVIEQTMFFLLESEKYGRNAAQLIVNAAGEIVVSENTNDFDDKAMQQIMSFLHPEQPELPAAVHHKPELEHHQKFFENGMYERSASFENHEEQNYNMIDGTFNNRRPDQRPSVRKRLQEKLALVQSRKYQEEERIK